MNNKVVFAGIAVLAVIGVVAVGPGDLSVAGIIGDASCEWQDLELEGQTFEGLDEVEQQYPDAYDLLVEQADTRIEDGVVQYQLSGCETGDFQ